MSPTVEGKQTFATKAALTFGTAGPGPGAVLGFVPHC